MPPPYATFSSLILDPSDFAVAILVAVLLAGSVLIFVVGLCRSARLGDKALKRGELSSSQTKSLGRWPTK